MIRFALTGLLALALGAGAVTSLTASDDNTSRKNNASQEGINAPQKEIDAPPINNRDRKNSKTINVPQEDNAPPRKNNYTPLRKNYNSPKKNYSPPRKYDNPTRKSNYNRGEKNYGAPRKDYGGHEKDECRAYKKVVCYKTVVCYVYEEEPYTRCIVKYDECGKAYKVHKTYYRSVKVPVKKVIPVVKYVKAGY